MRVMNRCPLLLFGFIFVAGWVFVYSAPKSSAKKRLAEIEAAEQEADKAIECLASLAESPYKEALVSLAHIAANRTA